MTRVHRFLLLAMFATGVCASVPANAKSLVLEEFFLQAGITNVRSYSVVKNGARQ